MQLDSSAVLAVVRRVADELCKRFAFGIYGPDDIRQEAVIHGLSVVPRYLEERATKRPGETSEGKLAAFVYRHVRNRLSNLIRDKLSRSDWPCDRCHAGDHCEPGGCRPYREWHRRNHAKASLMRPNRLAGSERVTPPRGCPAEVRELRGRVEDRLPIRLRGDWLRALAGCELPPARREALYAAVRAAVADGGVDRAQA